MQSITHTLYLFDTTTFVTTVSETTQSVASDTVSDELQAKQISTR